MVPLSVGGCQVGCCGRWEVALVAGVYDVVMVQCETKHYLLFSLGKVKIFVKKFLFGKGNFFVNDTWN